MSGPLPVRAKIANPDGTITREYSTFLQNQNRELNEATNTGTDHTAAITAIGERIDRDQAFLADPDATATVLVKGLEQRVEALESLLAVLLVPEEGTGLTGRLERLEALVAGIAEGPDYAARIAQIETLLYSTM